MPVTNAQRIERLLLSIAESPSDADRIRIDALRLLLDFRGDKAVKLPKGKTKKDKSLDALLGVRRPPKP